MGYLKCIKITKEYEKASKALRSVSFKVPSEGIFALIGRNGAGKTTLVRILATQLLPTSGSANLAGMDVVKDAKDLRGMIACVPQEARAIGWLTPRQFILSYLLWRGMDYSEAKRKTEDATKMLGIDQHLDTANRLLSGGTKRKVLVASVIASGAKILFLDEPTTGLDPISRSDLWRILSKLKRTHFIFLTTHYLEEAERLADKIGILDEGKLLALGTLEELRATVKYPYIIKILSDRKMLKPREGTVVKGVDGYYQIATKEKDAYEISKELIKEGVKFSMNPLSLDDIFYYIVKKPIEEERYEDEEKHY